MKWFKKKKKQNEEAGYLFQYNGIDIQTVDVRLFPDRATVFVDPTETHETVFFPLCSINMALLNPAWNFYGHFIYVYREPNEGLEYKRHYTHYCGDYSLGFDYVNGKYEMQATLKMLRISQDYQRYQEKAKKKYQYFVEDYKENGLDGLLPKYEDLNFLVKRFGKAPIWVQKDETPVDLNGKKLVFIGQVRVLDFIGEDQYLYLFYNPEGNYFVQREQYT